MRGTGFGRQLPAHCKGVAFMEHNVSVNGVSSMSVNYIVSTVLLTNELVSHTCLQSYVPLYNSYIRHKSAKPFETPGPKYMCIVFALYMFYSL